MRDFPIDIASSANRLRRLEQLSLKAERAGDLVLVAKCLELVASEQRAAPCGMQGDGLPPLTPEQARLELDEFLRKAIDAHELSKSEDRMQHEADAGPDDCAEPGLESE